VGPGGAGDALVGAGGAPAGSGGAGDTGGAGGAGGGGDSGGGGAGGTTGGGITSIACAGGDGYALWQLSWDANSAGYADVDGWDNGCAYSLADQGCSLSGEPHTYANFGPGVLFNSSNDYFRVLFSVQGLSFNTATLYISAHAEGGGIANGVFESPIYGSTNLVPTVPISQHRSYSVDWTNYLSPTDTPSLTAVTLRSMPTGLAISSMELCVQ
jgi:hypothetical protein